MLKHLLFFTTFLLSIVPTLAQGIAVKTNPQTGAVSSLRVEGDETGMDWLVHTDGSQYTLVTEKYGWGLGYATLHSKGKERRVEWLKPENTDSTPLIYSLGEAEMQVERTLSNGHLYETYTLRNTSDDWLTIEDAAIYTPWNDNYPSGQECIQRRCNAHIWAEGGAAYVQAVRMGARVPHVSLILTEGCLDGYDVWCRQLWMEQGAGGPWCMGQNMRGIFALRLPVLRLRAGEQYRLSWVVQSNEGDKDFHRQLSATSGYIEANRYLLQVGEKTPVHFISDVGRQSQTFTAREVGEHTVTFRFQNGKKAVAHFCVVEDIEKLVSTRLRFIRERQQMLRRDDQRYGAYMVYDCDADSIYLNDRPNCNPVDRDEGAERLGMGIALAKSFLCGKKRDKAVLQSLLHYADFLRNKLQTPDYVIYSSVDHTQRNRAYNYPWVAEFYFLMFEATGERRYAADGYETLRSMFRQFGHSFYAIGFPLELSMRVLQKAGMKEERELLLADFRKECETLMEIGLNYPPSEVNYEQSIVAPVVQLLSQMYLVTHEQQWLDGAWQQMPVMLAFNGHQPSYHLNDIAIRHWDGYWFGKYELWGDTFPHYWSAITASALNYMSRATGDKTMQLRAENIVRQNLCLFTADGRASCAYLYPNRVNGAPARLHDPWANDQDFALSYYFQVFYGL